MVNTKDSLTHQYSSLLVAHSLEYIWQPTISTYILLYTDTIAWLALFYFAKLYMYVFAISGEEANTSSPTLLVQSNNKNTADLSLLHMYSSMTVNYLQYFL